MAGPESSLGRPEEEFIEEEGTPKFGANVTIRSFWGRHAQKQSGEVTGGDGLSTSSISEKGQSKSVTFGEGQTASKDGAKPYASDSARTQETVQGILVGYQRSNPEAPIRGLRVKDEISSRYPAEFLNLYDQKFVAERARLMQEIGLEPSSFKTLSPDQQEEIAEKAEEPVLREWLQPGTTLNMLFAPEICAAKFASIFTDHSARMAEKLYSGSEVDLFHNTHKSIMEPFWISGVLIRARDGKRIESLDDLGTSVQILEQWESVTSTNEDKFSDIRVKIRGIDYIVDRERLIDLVEKDKKYSKLKTELKSKIYSISQELGENPGSVSAEDLMIFIREYYNIGGSDVTWQRGYEERRKFINLVAPNANVAFQELAERVEQGKDLETIIEQCAINSDNTRNLSVLVILMEKRPELSDKIFTRIQEYQDSPENVQSFIPPLQDPNDLELFKKWGYDGLPEHGRARALRIKAEVAAILRSRLQSFTRHDIDPGSVPVSVLKNEASFFVRAGLDLDPSELDKYDINFAKSGMNEGPIADFEIYLQPLLYLAERSLDAFKELRQELQENYPEVFNKRMAKKLDRVASRLNSERTRFSKRYPGRVAPVLYDGFSSRTNVFASNSSITFERSRLEPYEWRKQHERSLMIKSIKDFESRN